MARTLTREDRLGPDSTLSPTVCQRLGAIVHEPAARPAFPTTLGRYHLLRCVGRGGMASVYEAVDTSLGRRVAIKLLADDADVRLVERLHREARAAATLHHPNIVAVHDVGSVDGRHFIAMDFVDGSTFDTAARSRWDRT